MIVTRVSKFKPVLIDMSVVIGQILSANLDSRALQSI
jgi:hypothetical protein